MKEIVREILHNARPQPLHDTRAACDTRGSPPRANYVSAWICSAVCNTFRHILYTAAHSHKKSRIFHFYHSTYSIGYLCHDPSLCQMNEIRSVCNFKAVLAHFLYIFMRLVPQGKLNQSWQMSNMHTDVKQEVVQKKSRHIDSMLYSKTWLTTRLISFRLYVLTLWVFINVTL